MVKPRFDPGRFCGRRNCHLTIWTPKSSQPERQLYFKNFKLGGAVPLVAFAGDES